MQWLRAPFRLPLGLSPFPRLLPSLLPFSEPAQIPLLHCRTAMSGRRTVTDVLMGNARAAAKAKNPTPASSDQTLTPSKKPRILGDDAKNLNEDPPVDGSNFTVELKRKCADFNPKKATSWKNGEPVPFLFLARALELISNESGRIAMTEILCNVFRAVIATTPGDLLATVYLSANKIAAPHEGIELGIGDASLIKALAEAYGRKEEQVKKQLKELGDLGLVAKASRSSQKVMFKPQPLTISKVFNTFRAIAKESGKDSQDKKRNHIKGLLVAATDCEPQYLVRLLQSKMRIGLAEKTVLVALAQASVFSETNQNQHSQAQPDFEEAGRIVKQVYSVLPIYDKIVPELLSVGVWKLQEACKFSLGVPVGPMLAKPTKAVSEILDKFQGTEFTCEYKYDGERAQIHYMEDGSVEIYSRNAERNTGKYPDVVSSVSRFKKANVKSFVLDCEIVAYDREKQKILPFQILSTRARKGVILSDIKVAVCTYAFDILYIDGQPLLQDQLKIRREYLYSCFEEVPGIFQFATAITSNDLEEIQKFLDTAVNSSCEGLIIKTLDKDATYEPSKRSNNWLKLKKDYMESIGDSLDLVPIAAFHGRGKRTGVYGSFLLACYDEHNEEYQSICNIGTGFSESQLEERSTSLRSKIIPKPKPYYRYSDTMNPDVWFEPSEVWEVKAADLSISPVHRAANGAVDANKGISLRFPRLLRVRDDKTPEEATTSDQVADMYRAQKINHSNNQDDDDD
ncbi:DNA ligase 1-like isoform X1 [Zingiber officinale]|uniref:DNA ligase 1-like isoform X1 n=1 Tax=Zingiber officinale TaxID=94328 RepID=UPI001C4B81EC|nr:DNA ligase 1-like isoform X1 [Zingiber officinale]